jgi:hypothetical protein
MIAFTFLQRIRLREKNGSPPGLMEGNRAAVFASGGLIRA